MTIFWFRRDLRLADNHGLYAALSKGEPVQAIFVFDKNILSKLADKNDARISFIHQQLLKLNAELAKLGSSLWVFYGDPLSVFKNELQAKMPNNTSVGNVYANHDYEPNAIQRDAAISEWLLSQNSELLTFKDQCIFEKKEVVKDDGLPYTVFTAYKNKYYKTLTAESFKSFDSQKYFTNFYANNGFPIPSLEEIGFEPSEIEFPVIEFESILKEYANTRNFPSVKGTSRISVHLRFGTVSIRALAKASFGKSETWFNELVWRDFYFQLSRAIDKLENPLKEKYSKIKWSNNKSHFDAWKNGKTGFPIVDAGMRQLNQTGFMHNRVRMVVASFLTKDLHMDWRLGEKYFEEKLIDHDPAVNSGNWQWAASTGCDSVPYFRIFNPWRQQERFDLNCEYIKKWIPELEKIEPKIIHNLWNKFPDNLNYVKPMVIHKIEAEKTKMIFKSQ